MAEGGDEVLGRVGPRPHVKGVGVGQEGPGFPGGQEIRDPEDELGAEEGLVARLAEMNLDGDQILLGDRPGKAGLLEQGGQAFYQTPG